MINLVNETRGRKEGWREVRMAGGMVEEQEEQWKVQSR